MPISVRQVEEALRQLGGEAQIGDILRKVLEIAPPPHSANARNIIRGRLYQFSSQTSAYKEGTLDLFESVDGLAANTGRWRLKDYHAAADNSDAVLEDTEADIEATEGRCRLRVHLSRERSKKLINAFKASLVTFACEACGSDMGEAYGPLGEGYIEAHHRVPVASLKDGEKTKLSDLAALCPNCHRMIHRNDLMSVEDLAAHIRARRPSFAIAAEADKGEWLDDAPKQGD
jgi:putative restriction endonuclease